MAAIQTINLVLRFMLELMGLAAAGYWGYTLPRSGVTRWLLAVLIPLAVAVFWGVVAAPKSEVIASPDLKRWIGTAVLLASAGALAAARKPELASIFAAAVVVNAALMQVWDQ